MDTQEDPGGFGALELVGGVGALALLGWAVHAATAKRKDPGHARPARPVFRTTTVNKPPSEVYRFWRNLEQLPQFMGNLESVTELDGGRSHWKARGPAGVTVEWDAEIVEDVPGQRIAWRSLPGADVDNRGRVTFRPAPGGRGTEICVELIYRAPAGKVGVAVARLLHREPGQEIESDLRRLKQVLETGEIVQSDASIHRFPHPARPSAETGAVS